MKKILKILCCLIFLLSNNNVFARRMYFIAECESSQSAARDYGISLNGNGWYEVGNPGGPGGGGGAGGSGDDDDIDDGIAGGGGSGICNAPSANSLACDFGCIDSTLSGSEISENNRNILSDLNAGSPIEGNDYCKMVCIPSNQFDYPGFIPTVEQGTKFSDILLNSSDNKFINAINGYLQNQMLTKKISSELFASDFENAVSDTASYMKAELSRLGFEIPENFTVSGTISADNFGVAFVNKLDDYLENIRNMISQFNASLSAPSFVFESRGGVSNASSGITYNQSFNIGSSKESTYEQITAWKNATMQAKLRGQ